MINNIIPTPKKVSVLDKEISLPLSISYTEDRWGEYADTISEAFEKIFKASLKKADGGILLKKDTSLPEKNYRYDSREGLTLSAADDEGILYALVTLLQTASVRDGKLILQRALIEDYPDKEYRALMVDLAREWHPAETVYQYIDLCFALKIKYLHLHFIDNERYTLPSKAFPKLNENDCYTHAEINKMRELARKRGIVIIPEFEAPGHAALLSECYPEVFANELECEVAKEETESGAVITDTSIFCAGKSSAMEGVKALITETCELFPEAPYIHIGGDEAKIAVWEHCPHCKAYMKEKGIADIYELYSEFVGRVARFVLDMGKTPIVWEGFPKQGIHYIPKETVVIAWESLYHMPYDLIAEGFKVINASWVPLYVVPNPEMRWQWGIPEILDWNIYNWQHWYPKSEAYKNPINVEPTEQVIGAELCLWECTFEEEISRAIRNLSALSERTWTVERLLCEQEFFNKAIPTLKRVARYIQAV